MFSSVVARILQDFVQETHFSNYRYTDTILLNICLPSTLLGNFLQRLFEDRTRLIHLRLGDIESRDEPDHIEYRRGQDQHTLLETLLGDSRSDVLDAGRAGGSTVDGLVGTGGRSGYDGCSGDWLGVGFEFDAVNGQDVMF